MSLEKAAKRLAAKGRNGDSVLVHMHPREVAGLQALAKANGSAITVNPDTGLPEAFSLRSLLPALAGAAMTYFSGGAINPYMAAGLIGAGTAASTGSVNKGLMAGLGAYGGAGLGAGAAGMGDAATAGMESGSQGAMLDAQTAGMADSASQGQMLAAQNAGMGGDMASGVSAAMRDPGAYATQFGGWGGLGKTAMMAAAPALAEQPAAPGVQKLPGNIRPYTLTRENLSGGTPTSSRERLQVRDVWTPGPVREAAAGGIMQLAAGGDVIPAISAATAAATAPRQAGVGAYDPSQVYGAGQSGAYSPASVYGAGAPTTQAAERYTPAPAPSLTAPEVTYNAGTPAYGKYMYDPSSGQFTVNPNWTSSQAAAHKASMLTFGNQDNIPSNAAGESGSMYAQGGIASLGGYSDGGRLLRGPGDGVSDSIPATIGGQQPARLADGEFVVPARIVSELGNGSTEAGSKKLYAMLDRIQNARAKTVGKDRVATDSKADRHLPA